jgi:hypothetical protein
MKRSSRAFYFLQTRLTDKPNIGSQAFRGSIEINLKFLSGTINGGLTIENSGAKGLAGFECKTESKEE